MNPENYGEQSQRHGEPPNTPFGEDITVPGSRTMPLEFHGEWFETSVTAMQIEAQL